MRHLALFLAVLLAFVCSPLQAQDASREHSPLRPADGSVELDTTGLTVDEVVARIAEMVRVARPEA